MMDEEGNINSGSAVKDSTSAQRITHSLNVGIKKHSRYVFWVVAVLGFLLQYTVVVYAVIMTYHLKWKKNGILESYACHLMIIGTNLVRSGVFFCAYLIGKAQTNKSF